jgi:hypothetical protein
VHFNLGWSVPLPGEEIYIMGQLTDWQTLPLNRMSYNADTRCMEATLLLKQGWYDYAYGIRDENGRLDEMRLEGSFSETGNDYEVFVYYHDRHKRTDRLTGYTVIRK